LLDGAAIIPIIGLPAITTNNPERYVDRIFDEVLQTFSRPDTLTTSLQDWRKGRRAEIQEVNGYAIDVLRRFGQGAPINQRVIDIAFEIEKGLIKASPDNASILIEALTALR
jgi:2-dehydropantoate 2-reductase